MPGTEFLQLVAESDNQTEFPTLRCVGIGGGPAVLEPREQIRLMDLVEHYEVHLAETFDKLPSWVWLFANRLMDLSARETYLGKENETGHWLLLKLNGSLVREKKIHLMEVCGLLDQELAVGYTHELDPWLVFLHNRHQCDVAEVAEYFALRVIVENPILQAPTLESVSQVLFANPTVDFRASYPCSATHIASILGIRAARNYLVQCVQELFEKSGTRVQPTHLRLMADALVATGRVGKLTYRGIDDLGGQVSVFNRMQNSYPAIRELAISSIVTDVSQGYGRNLFAVEEPLSVEDMYVYACHEQALLKITT